MEFTYATAENETSFDRNYRKYLKTMSDEAQRKLDEFMKTPESRRLIKRLMYDTWYGMSINLDCENDPFASRNHWMKPLMEWTGLTDRYGRMVCKHRETISMFYDIKDTLRKCLDFRKTLDISVFASSKRFDIKQVISSFYLKYVEEPIDDSTFYLASYKPVYTFYPKIDFKNIKWEIRCVYGYMPPLNPYAFKDRIKETKNEMKRHFINKYVNK